MSRWSDPENGVVETGYWLEVDVVSGCGVAQSPSKGCRRRRRGVVVVVRKKSAGDPLDWKLGRKRRRKKKKTAFGCGSAGAVAVPVGGG